MKREEYINWCSTKKYNTIRSCNSSTPSKCDPSFAQTGRQQLTNPLNIQPRGVYGAPIEIDKNNPFNIKEFDKAYPDRLKAMEQARVDVYNTKKHLDTLQDKYNTNQQNQQENEK